MKVLMILEREFPEDERVEKEALSLIKNGYEVHIACFTKENRDANELYKGIHLHRKKISNFIHKKASVGALMLPFYFNFWENFIMEIIRGQKFDVIHIHDLPLAKKGYEIAKSINARCVLDLHENWTGLLEVSLHTKTFFGKMLSSNTQWDKYESKYCDLADLIIVVVEEARYRLVNKGIAKDKIAVVSNTISIPFNFKVKESDKEFTFIYAGGITYHRGIQFVLEGLAELNKSVQSWRLVLVGSGSYVEVLKSKAQELGISSKIFFKGHKSYVDMISLLSSSDCCLIPHVKSSHTDNTIPNKLFQYMFLKKPVLASNCDPVVRILNETKGGLSYKFDDKYEFKNKALEIINSPDNTFGLNGYKSVLDKYNWQTEELILIESYKYLKKKAV